VADLEGASPGARAARLRIAEVYEQELELPERAEAVRAQLPRP
jgi:hypothetical protein